MWLKIYSASSLGIQAELIDVEVDLSVASKPSYHVVERPDTAIKDSGQQVRATIHNCGYSFHSQDNITINLAPADFKKEGSCYDLWLFWASAANGSRSRSSAGSSWESFL